MTTKKSIPEDSLSPPFRRGPDQPDAPLPLTAHAVFCIKVPVLIAFNARGVKKLFVAANFLTAVGRILDIVLTLYMYVIIARALVSWVNPDPYNPIVNFLHKVTEPVLFQVRRRLPLLGGVDLSPLVVLLAIYFLKKFVVDSILQLGARMMLSM